MFKDFWQKRWDENQIGFHEGRPNAYLERFAERLRTHEAPRLLVPLCGKAIDLGWLGDQGFRVLGVEFVQEAAEAFFQDTGLKAVWDEDGGLPCLTSEPVRIAVGDFFAWDPNKSDPLDGAYDRAALVAVRPEQRPRYVDQLLAALRPGARILLISFSYEPNASSGPPFSVDADEVKRLFSTRCTIELLADEDILDREPRFRERGLHWLREQAWYLVVR